VAEPHPDQILFSFFVMNTKSATKEQVDECMAIHMQNPEIHLGQVLLEKGYINQAKLKMLEMMAGKPIELRMAKDTEADSPKRVYLQMKQLAEQGKVDEAEKLYEQIKDDKEYGNAAWVMVKKAKTQRDERAKASEEE
jgi:pentatricopeptide repeat protein